MLDLTPSGGRAKTLLIGGDAELQRYLRGLLEAAEVELIQTGDGGLGLERPYDEHSDVVLLDFELPDLPGLRVPLNPELVARIEAVLRRPREGSQATVIRDEFIQIDRPRHEVKVLDVDVALTPTEFRMLVAFAENPGRVLGHGRLLDKVWGDRIRGRDEVKLYVSYIRRKLGRAAGVDPIETVRGVGYRYRPRRTAAPSGATRRGG